MLVKALAVAGGIVAIGGLALATSQHRPPATSSKPAGAVVQGRPGADRKLGDAAVADGPARSAPTDGPLKLGAQTHFSQNWPISALQQADAIHVRTLRDGMPWGAGERSPGQYVMPANAKGPLTAFCRSGGDVVLTIEPRNRLYDDGMTVSSDVGIKAYATYIAAVVAALGDRCVAGIEVGNEINNPRNLPYPKGIAVAERYVALVRATRDAVRARGFHTAILGGSTNVIGTGFLAGLFRAGLLDAADGIAVHPYRRHAENVDVELAHLNAVMASFGRLLPIWATEFSHTHPDPTAAPGDLLKMATLMSAAGVKRAYWYALIDQSAFPTLGLFTRARTPKPAAATFALVAERLADAGRAERVDTGDAVNRLYRFAGNRYVAWGAAGKIRFEGRAVVRDARGSVIAGNGPFALGADPILVEGATGFTIDHGPVLADSLLGYGAAPWSYRVDRADGRSSALGWHDTSFGSARSGRDMRPAVLGDIGGTPAGDAAHAIRPVLRYTAPTQQAVSLAACVHYGATKDGDGIDVAVRVNGREVKRVVVTDGAMLSGIDADLPRGGTIDMVFGPNQTAGRDNFSFRAWVKTRGASGEPPCP